MFPSKQLGYWLLIIICNNSVVAYRKRRKKGIIGRGREWLSVFSVLKYTHLSFCITMVYTRLSLYILLYYKLLVAVCHATES